MALVSLQTVPQSRQTVIAEVVATFPAETTAFARKKPHFSGDVSRTATEPTHKVKRPLRYDSAKDLFGNARHFSFFNDTATTESDKRIGFTHD